MFEGKAGAFPSEAPFRRSSLRQAQKLDMAGKACQGQTLTYYEN